jgi:hypothetical protein
MSKKFKPFDYAMENIRLQAGVGIGGMMTENINNATGNHVDTGPANKMLSTLPMVHASKGVFLGLNELKYKRKHK